MDRIFRSIIAISATRCCQALLWFGLVAFSFQHSKVVGQSFVERGLEAGLGDAIHTNGVAVADYDLDGDLDLYVVASKHFDPQDPSTWNRLYRNNGDRTFTDVTDFANVRASQVPGFQSRSLGNRFSASWADYDSDGDPDLLLAGVGPEVLYQNQGDGTFADVSGAAGINAGVAESDSSETVGATWWDYDADGVLDVYLSNWRGPNRLYKGVVGGHFAEATLIPAIDSVRTWTALPFDANLDGALDLYLANDFGPNSLYLADGSGGFVDRTFDYRVGDQGNGMGIALGDINGDLILDLFVTNIASTFFENVLYIGTRNPPYEEVARFLGVEDAGWGWGTEFFDVDADGDLDLYAVNGFILEGPTPNRLWRNDLYPSGSVTFEDVSASSGAGDDAESRGLVVFDYDADGDLDLLVATWSDRVKLFENRTPQQNWLQIVLRGSVSNRDALGTLVRLASGTTTQVRSHDGVDIFGQSLVPLHFGLGQATHVDQLTVTWPSGVVEEYSVEGLNRVITLTEGSGVTGKDVAPDVPSVHSFPNPVGDRLYLSSDYRSIQLFDMTGQLRLSGSGQSSNAANGSGLDVSGLESGVYLCTITTLDQGLVRRLVVKH